VAQGRVWTGTQAKERGLVDRTGSLADAIAAARSKAKLPDDARFTYIAPERGKLEQLLARFGVQEVLTARITVALSPELAALAVPGALAEAQAELAWLAQMSDRAKAGMPFLALTHCLCDK
jgi:protease IV